MLTVRQRLATMRRTGVDAGITLTELLVTMVLMTIVMGLALSWFLGESSTDTKTQNSSFAQGGARTVLQSWPALLQVADSPWYGRTALPASGSPTPSPTATLAPGLDTGRFLAITANSITFNADLANAPSSNCGDSCQRSAPTSQVTLALSNGALTQTIVQSGAATKSITLVRTGAALANTCLFSAYDSAGTALSCTSATPLGSIARVVLAFTVTPDLNGTPQTYQTSIGITGQFAPEVSSSATASAGT